MKKHSGTDLHKNSLKDNKQKSVDFLLRKEDEKVIYAETLFSNCG